jgi:hypothetical protein
MNYYTAMMQSFEREKNRQATMITVGVALAMLFTFILWKWPLPKLELPPQETLVEVALEDFPPTVRSGGGGGGGNKVQADQEKGIAKASVPPGIPDETKELRADDKDPEAPAINKTVATKPEAKIINQNASIVKTNPKPVVETPAPPKPKAVAGKTLSGTGTGGGTADKYDIAGGDKGGGNGVGKGPGYGGNSGGGAGGGNGTGLGTGNGPRRVSGSRKLLTSVKLDAGENISGKVQAVIQVSPDGVGTLVRTVNGSLMSDPQAKDIIRDWLRKNRFDKTGEESQVIYEFNIRTGG